MPSTKTENCTIRYCRLGCVGHGMYGLNITVEFGGGVIQGLPPIRFCTPDGDGTAVGMTSILHLMRVFGVEHLDEIAGKPARVQMCGEQIKHIGHFMENRWFCYEQVVEHIRDKVAGSAMTDAHRWFMGLFSDD